MPGHTAHLRKETTMPTSVFAAHRYRVYAHRWKATIEIGSLCGGVPQDSNKLEAWLRASMGESSEDRIRATIAEYMVENEVDAEVALKEVMNKSHLNGFRRFTPALAETTPGAVAGGLYAEGRC